MDKYDIYNDIEKRTGGDVYIGVVGPVRSGKSTFVSNFMKIAVIPEMTNKNKKAVALDELPQSGEGKTVTTVEPKFVPQDATLIKLKNGAKAKVRLIDCVGYMVDGAMGHMEDSKPRMVKTPWSDDAMTFEEAGELGTKKVITNHSTIGIMVTCDGSFTGISREAYEKTEERVVDELNNCQKPFVIIYNCKEPESDKVVSECQRLSEKYGTMVVAKDLLNMNESDVYEILSTLLMEFPVKTASVKLPDWMRTLSYDNRLIAPLMGLLRDNISSVKKMKDLKKIEEKFEEIDYITAVSTEIDSGEGNIKFVLTPTEECFFEELSNCSGQNLSDKLSLMQFAVNASKAQKNYDKLKGALIEANETGYGIVPPSQDEIDIEEPEMVKNGGSYGVKIKATAPSLHIVKVEIGAEVNSVVGREKQCTDYVDSLKRQYEENPQGVMQVDLFGRPLYSFVSEEIYDKAGGMKPVFKEKLCKTVTKLVNEKKSALFCVTI